ncbi:MAG: response regulator transcription factor [Lentimicrobiaceae bacterium]|nr:response regulator transcription factor [Lentimicrobiaceae bacterium]
MITVLLVDDHTILADGLRKLIEEAGDIKVDNIAHNLKECRYELRYKLPDVLLLDISLPDGNGVEFCKELNAKYPDLKILALTTYSEYSTVRQMLDNGALGYVIKNAMMEELIKGIRTVAEGKKFLCHEIDLLMKKSSHSNVWLTPRERELLRLVVEGYSSAEIAGITSLGQETIKGYRKNLLLKLGAKNTATLVKIALEEKLLW